MKANILVISAITLLSFSLNSFSQTGYKVSRKISIPGNGSWDYLTVDTLHEHLFVSHVTEVNVVDLKTGTLINTIKDTKGVHGITLAYDLNKGYISNGKDSSVTIFDLKSLETKGKVNVTGRNPDAILYDPFSHQVFTFNGRTGNATVIDAKTDKVVGTIALDGKPEFAVTDKKGRVYVNIEDKSVINVINTSTLKIEEHWPIAPGEEPSGLAIDNINHRLFSVCDNKTMVVIDATNGKVLKSLPIGEHVDGAAFDGSEGLVFSSNGDGTLTIVKASGNNFDVSENLPTMKWARTIALDEKTHKLYLPTAELLPAAKENARPSVKPDSFLILEISK